MTTLILSAVVSALLGSGTGSTDATNHKQSFLGIDVCTGRHAQSEDCDVRLFTPSPPAAREGTAAEPRGAATEPGPSPLAIDLLGMRICLGPVPADLACDLRLDAPPNRESSA